MKTVFWPPRRKCQPPVGKFLAPPMIVGLWINILIALAIFKVVQLNEIKNGSTDAIGT